MAYLIAPGTSFRSAIKIFDAAAQPELVDLCILAASRDIIYLARKQRWRAAAAWSIIPQACG